MLYMVIERFKGGDPAAVGSRFAEKGRMMDEGLHYVSSWIEPGTGKCFQLMETSAPALLNAWIARWDDLVDFEVVPVVTSSEYWASLKGT